MANVPLRRSRTSIGFTTIDRQPFNWTETDSDLVRINLMNQFMTRKGERLMLPRFGSIIWEMLFEPFTESVRAAIIEDSVRIIREEPRVNLVNLDVQEEPYGLTLDMTVEYVGQDLVETLAIRFDRDLAG